MKVFKKMVLLCFAFILSISMVGCGKKEIKPDTVDSLDVYCWKAGYDVLWVEPMIKEFANQDWVKEKYPNLTYDIITNDINTFTESAIRANNKWDLYFAPDARELIEKDGNGQIRILDLADGVYNKEIPGENILFKDKMYDTYLDSYTTKNADGSSSYYVSPWAGGMGGILYNHDLLVKKYGISIPNTTDELIDVLKQIQDKNKDIPDDNLNKVYPIISSENAPYINYMFNIWWAQYQTIKGFNDFYNGKVGPRISRNIFLQEGRRESLKVFENMFKDKGNLYPKYKLIDNALTQTMFLKGSAVFMGNGDWFEKETKTIKDKIKEEEGKDYDIRFLPSPIISAIIDVLPDKTIKDDKTLSKVVSAIDNNKPYTSVKGVSENDYNTVREARKVTYSIGTNHTAVIPSNALGKDVAQDFLLFMASDKGNRIYIEYTSGGNLPFDYNLKEKDIELYNSLGSAQRSRYDLEYSATGLEVLKLPNAFPLCKLGGVSAFTEENFMGIFAETKPKYTSDSLFEQTKEFWSGDRWNLAVSAAGL